MTTVNRSHAEQEFANGIAGLEQTAAALEATATMLREKAAAFERQAAAHGDDYVTHPSTQATVLQVAQQTARDIGRAHEWLYDAVGEVSKATEAYR